MPMKSLPSKSIRTGSRPHNSSGACRTVRRLFSGRGSRLAVDVSRHPLTRARSTMTRSFAQPTFVLVSLLATLLGACKSDAPPPKECVAYPPDLTLSLETGLLRRDFRIANAWAVKSDKPTPAYFLSADIVAPNGEAVVGTWVTDD